MTAAEVLSELRFLRIRLRNDKGKLICDAPAGALTNELRKALIDHKAEILALLARAYRSQPPLRRSPRDGDCDGVDDRFRLWFIDQLEPGSVMYNVPKAFRVRGRLSVERLEQSLTEIVRRHEVLRTTFSAIGGQPMQKISPI